MKKISPLARILLIIIVSIGVQMLSGSLPGKALIDEASILAGRIIIEGLHRFEKPYAGKNKISVTSDASVDSETECTVDPSDMDSGGGEIPYSEGDYKYFPASEEGREESAESSRFFMTAEEVGAFENLELKEKLTGIAILGKVPKEELDSIYSMIENGITYHEMLEIRLLLEKYLSDIEIGRLYDILQKRRQQQSGEIIVRR